MSGRARTWLVGAWLVAATAAAAPTAAAAAAIENETGARAWRVEPSAYLYVVPGGPDFVMLTATADRGRWHLEARYDYEALLTGSAFAGANFRWDGGGEHGLSLELTPMLGAAAGALDGVVPALRLCLAWWRLDLESESELVIDLRDPSASFFYDWTELGFSPLAWLRVGAVVQRSRVFPTTLDFQRGAFAEVTLRDTVSFAIYELNAGWAEPTFVFAASARLP